MKKPAFTLIELLVTVSVMALLSGLIMINIYGNLAKGRDAKRKNDLREIRTSLELYFSVNNDYPPSDAAWGMAGMFTSSTVGLIKGCDGTTNCSWGKAFVNNGVTYMSALPTDPKGNQYYFYVRHPQGHLAYIIATKLERANDPDLIPSQEACKDVFDTPISFDANVYVMCDSQ